MMLSKITFPSSFTERIISFLTKYSSIQLRFVFIGLLSSILAGCSDSFEKQFIDSNDRNAFLKIDASLCTTCGECFKYCPNGAIDEVKTEKNTYVYILDPKKCIKCGICTKKCIYGAIKWKR